MVVLHGGWQQLGGTLKVADDKAEHALLGAQWTNGCIGGFVVVLKQNHLAPATQQVEVGHAAHQVGLAHGLVLHLLAHLGIAIAGDVVDDGVGEGHHGVHSSPCMAHVLRESRGLEESELGIVVGVEGVVGAQRPHADDGVVVIIRPRLVVERLGGLDHGIVAAVVGIGRVLVEGRTVEEIFAAGRKQHY